MAFFKLLSLEENDQGRHASLIMHGSVTQNWWDEDTISAHFAQLLASLGTLNRISIDLDSDGGSVSAGIAIANLLIRNPAHVHIRVSAMAASIASVIACAADTLELDVGAMMFLHKPELSCYGNADDFAQAKETLDKHQDAIMAHYVRKAGEEKRAQIEAILNKGGYLSAQECKDLGLADIINPDASNQLPDTVGMAKRLAQATVKAQAQPTITTKETETDPETETEPKAEPKAEPKDWLQEERQRVKEILNLCQVAQCPELGIDLVSSGASLASAQVLVANFAANRQTPINPQNNRLSNTPQPVCNIDSQAIYAQMNQRKF